MHGSISEIETLDNYVIVSFSDRQRRCSRNTWGQICIKDQLICGRPCRPARSHRTNQNRQGLLWRNNGRYRDGEGTNVVLLAIRVFDRVSVGINGKLCRSITCADDDLVRSRLGYRRHITIRHDESHQNGNQQKNCGNKTHLVGQEGKNFAEFA